jgi:hypothetical protein
LNNGDVAQDGYGVGFLITYGPTIRSFAPAVFGYAETILYENKAIWNHILSRSSGIMRISGREKRFAFSSKLFPLTSKTHDTTAALR